MDVEIVLLGTGTCVPSLRRSSPSLAVRIAGQTLLFDIGWGAIRRMLEADLAIEDIEYIFLTHAHPDHMSDLMPLLFALRHLPDHLREQDIHVCGPEHVGEVIASLRKIYGVWIEGDTYDILFHNVGNSPVEQKEWHVSGALTRHTIPSLAYRCETQDGKAVVYSGDTGYAPELVAVAEGADVLISECSYPEGSGQNGHLDPALAGKIAEEAGCKKLILVHLYPVCDTVDIVAQCAKYYGGEIVMGQDLMRVQV
jgi:ribonuclease BN (tRNA processing enzyme)